MATTAIEESKQLDGIGFPEFTAKLVTDTFEALVNANLTQMEAYIELMKETGPLLKEYINNTKNDVAPELILEFLAAKAPALNNDVVHTSSVYKGKTLTEEDATALNAAIKTDAEAGREVEAYEENQTLSDENWNKLLDNVASVISQNKYTLLKEMVRQGMLRLVVDNGTIETRLNFHATSTKNTYANTSDYERDTRRNTSRSSAGGSVFGIFRAGGSNKTVTTSLNVSTARSSESTNDSTTVDIFGGVKINFSTDYLKLSDV